MFKIYRAAYSSEKWGRDEKLPRWEMLHLILLFASPAFTEKVSISPLNWSRWLRFWPDPSLLAAHLHLLPHLLPRWSSGSISQWWTPSGRGLPGRGAHGPGGHEGVCLLLPENEVAPHQVLCLNRVTREISGPFGCSPVWRKEFEEFRGDDDHRQVQSLLLRGIVRGRLQDKISKQEDPLIELI